MLPNALDGGNNEDESKKNKTSHDISYNWCDVVNAIKMSSSSGQDTIQTNVSMITILKIYS